MKNYSLIQSLPSGPIIPSAKHADAALRNPYFLERSLFPGAAADVLFILPCLQYSDCEALPERPCVPAGSTRILETKILVVPLAGCLHQELISVFPGGGYEPADSTRNFESKIIVVLLGLAPPL